MKIDDVLSNSISRELRNQYELSDIPDYVERNIQANHVPERIKQRVNDFFCRVYKVCIKCCGKAQPK